MYFFHWDEIVEAFRGTGKKDVHSRLMGAYKKVPWWWWTTLIVIMLALSIVMTEVYHAGLPVYGVFLAFAISSIYMIPCGIIQAITNVNSSQINVLAEFIGGYMLQGKPFANLLFKILSTDVVGQGIYCT